MLPTRSREIFLDTDAYSNKQSIGNIEFNKVNFENTNEDVIETNPSELNQKFPPANDFEGSAKILIKANPEVPIKDSTHYGNNNNYISVYIGPHPIPNEEGKIDDDWYVYAQFALDIWNPNHSDCHLPSGSSHRFSKNETDWGFSSLVDSKQMASPNFRLNQDHAILENNKLNITAYVAVEDD